jgi:hypothetical protein
VCEYVALSYVWGGVSQIELNDKTVPHLIRRGSLDDDRTRPSRTIYDAMEVCTLLGKRYLWVDALCIKQTSSRDRLMQILRMRRIYAGAYLTIIAATGVNADCALTTDEYSAKYPCVTSEIIYQDSIWRTRGWTFPGRGLLASPAYLCQSRTFFKCHSATWMVDPVLQDITPVVA